jgi:hypothetical protein
MNDWAVWSLLTQGDHYGSVIVPDRDALEFLRAKTASDAKGDVQTALIEACAGPWGNAMAKHCLLAQLPDPTGGAAACIAATVQEFCATSSYVRGQEARRG